MKSSKLQLLCGALTIALALPLALMGCGESQPLPLAQRYPGPWHDDLHIGISRALVKNKIRGCGEYKYRPSIKDSGEYLVHCSADGARWSAYIVWEHSGAVTGPHAPDPSL